MESSPRPSGIPSAREFAGAKTTWVRRSGKCDERHERRHRHWITECGTVTSWDRLAGLEYKTTPKLPSLPLSLPTTLIICNGFHRFRHLQGMYSLPETPTFVQLAHFVRRSCTSPQQHSRNHDRVSLFASFAIVFPPLGVFLEKGCGADLCINILLVRHHSRSCLSNPTNVIFSDPSGLHVRSRSRLPFIPD